MSRGTGQPMAILRMKVSVYCDMLMTDVTQHP